MSMVRLSLWRIALGNAEMMFSYIDVMEDSIGKILQCMSSKNEVEYATLIMGLQSCF